MAAALLATQCQDSGQEAACRLQLLGQGELRLTTTLWITETTDQQFTVAVAAGDPQALAALINRITLDCFQRTGTLDNAFDQLRQQLNVPYGNEARERLLLTALDACEARLWPLSRAWVLPLLLYLAEAYGHSRLRDYEHALLALDAPLPAVPHLYHYLSKPHYRNGRYGLAVKELVHGFKLLHPETGCTTSALGLLGQLLNILIDLNLPAAGQVVDDVLESCLAQNYSVTAERYRRNRLDRAGRLALRRGRLALALGQFKQKYRQALREGEDGGRELAWLLYVSAWLGNLHSLLGETVEAKDWLERSQTQRWEALPYLEQVPAWLGNGRLGKWTEQLEQRARQEAGVLLANTPPDSAQLVKTGLLPL